MQLWTKYIKSNFVDPQKTTETIRNIVNYTQKLSQYSLLCQLKKHTFKIKKSNGSNIAVLLSNFLQPASIKQINLCVTTLITTYSKSEKMSTYCITALGLVVGSLYWHEWTKLPGFEITIRLEGIIQITGWWNLNAYIYQKILKLVCLYSVFCLYNGIVI